VQVEIKEINGFSKEIVLTVEAERTEQAYQKYLAKAAKSVEVPGFRKGKAPLHMVEKLHSERIKDYFEKDFVDEVFDEAAKENDIHFLLYPEVKELNWNSGEEMVIKLEIEHEPAVEIVNTEGLEVPFRPISLEDEAYKVMQELAQENSTILDIETAEEQDTVNADLHFTDKGKAHHYEVRMYAGNELPQRSLPILTGAKTGDVVETELTGKQIKLLCMDKELHLAEEAPFICKLEVKSITRIKTPEIDDDFARDMDFADLEEMKTKVSEDLRLKTEHRNMNNENAAIISQLYKENQFPLPQKTMRYLLMEELEKLEQKYREIFYQYYIQSIAQEMVSIYITKALRNKLQIEPTNEMVEAYIEHQAILEDVTPSVFKEQHKNIAENEDFSMAALNFHILRTIAASSTYVEPPEEPEHDHEHDHDHEHEEEES
jgi:trigger factor